MAGSRDSETSASSDWYSGRARLWAQNLVRSKACRLFKVLGTENPADLMTKPLARIEIDGHLERLGLSRATGRAETAPRADAEVDTTLADRCPGRKMGATHTNAAW